MSRYSMYEETKGTTKVVSSGIGFSGLLQIAFIVLKLCNVIDWNWVFVLLPLIISGGIFIITMVIALFIIVINN